MAAGLTPLVNESFLVLFAATASVLPKTTFIEELESFTIVKVLLVIDVLFKTFTLEDKYTQSLSSASSKSKEELSEDAAAAEVTVPLDDILA